MLPTVADAYQDYNDILTELGQENPENVYETIMSKEDSRINLINRIIDDRAVKLMQDSNIFNRSIYEIVTITLDAWYKMFSSVVAITNNLVTSSGGSFKGIGPELVETFWADDKKIYTGIFIVCVSLVLFFISISD